jgi:transcriptional regulator with XRE-family HTH domain
LESRPTLGQVLAEGRKKQGKSLRDVASRIKKDDGSSISPQYLNDIEHDRRTPSPAVLEQLAKVFSLAPEYLHFLAGSMPSDLAKTRGVTEDQVVEAYKAFRRKLGG